MPFVTFTRSSSASYLDSTGAWQTAATDVARYDYNPSTLVYRGLLIEEQRTNLLLNSATLSTQNVTTTNVINILSFEGTGTVTLTGTSTAGPLVGTGTNNRVQLAFTPTAGTLTVTVSGTVSNAQLEAGTNSKATSYIPTTGTTVTRSADFAIINTVDSVGFSPEAGTWVAESEVQSESSACVAVATNDSAGNYSAGAAMLLRRLSSIAQTGGNNMAISSTTTFTGKTVIGSSYRASTRSFTVAAKIGGPSTNTGTTVPDYTGRAVAKIRIGVLTASGSMALNGWITKLRYYPFFNNAANLDVLVKAT